MKPTDPQPAPKRGRAQHTVDLVRADLEERKAMGVAKYGVAHQHDNGRDHLVDQYQELLDAAVYTRAEIERRKELSVRVEAYVDHAVRVYSRGRCHCTACENLRAELGWPP